MKNRRLLRGIVLANALLACMLACALLISDGMKSHSDENAADAVSGEPDLVIYPGGEAAAGADDGKIPAGADGENAPPDAADDGQDALEIIDEPKEGAEAETLDAAKKRAWIEEKMDAMTIGEKVCQLFMLSPEKLTGVSRAVAAGETTKNAVNEFPVGGIIYFAANIETPDQITQMLSNTQSYAMERVGVPMFLAVDEEGGYVTRIAKNKNFDVETFPYASEIGQSKDASAAYRMGNAIGAYLNDYGFNVDFAPVADVLSNPENQVVKERSFGSDAQTVSDMVLAELDGLREQRIIGCVKHFPGHGATAGDTHEGYAYTTKTWEELLACEVIPFSDSIGAGVPMVMVGHISLPNVAGDDTPASMSECVITEHLRKELGYDGIVITDSLSMGAITNSYGSKEAAVGVLKAGGDMLLDPADFQGAYEGILSAVASGSLSEERIDESVYRILNVKYELIKHTKERGVNG